MQFSHKMCTFSKLLQESKLITLVQSYVTDIKSIVCHQKIYDTAMRFHAKTEFTANRVNVVTVSYESIHPFRVTHSNLPVSHGLCIQSHMAYCNVKFCIWCHLSSSSGCVSDQSDGRIFIDSFIAILLYALCSLSLSIYIAYTAAIIHYTFCEWNVYIDETYFVLWKGYVVILSFALMQLKACWTKCIFMKTN